MGEIYALSCALVWAFAVILLRRSGVSVSPFQLNLFRVVFSAPLIAGTMLVVGIPFLHGAPARDYLILIVSGVIGIALSDTLFHKSLNLVGAGITAIIDTAYAPTTVLLAYLFLAEQVRTCDLLGMGLIISAVLLSSTLQPPEGRSARDLVMGIGLGIMGIALLALSIIIAKPVLNRSPVMWAVAVRQFGSLIVLVGIAAFSPGRGRIFAVLRPSHAWRAMVPATVLGSYIALILWVAGMKYTLASIAAILNQSSTVFILILSVVLLRERMTLRKAISGLLAFAGVLLVALR
ncbi:MAG: DMT family transporter [Candidatus Eisenbacteria sp.]|nr:DMT family transporter [Candidatus Eisenbacteria bacterium]